MQEISTRTHPFFSGKSSNGAFFDGAFRDIDGDNFEESESIAPARQGSPIASALIGLGISIVAIWSASFLPTQVINTMEARAQIAQPAAHSALFDEPEQLPPASAVVKAGALGLYHWQRDCPLDNAISLRANRKLQRQQSVRLSRRAAQFKGLAPCRYCLEIEDWRQKGLTAKLRQ